MNTKLTIFDLDGTLLDSRADLASAVNAMRAGYGLPPLDLETVTGYIGNGVRKLVHRALQGHPADLEEAMRRTSSYYRDHLHDASTLYEGVPEGLAALADEGWTMAVCSNKPEALCRTLVAYYQLDAFFARVAGGDSYPTMKPDPQPIRAIMAACGAGCDTTWVVGDSATDVNAARAAGVRSMYVTYGYSAPDDVVPDRTAARFPAAVNHLLRAFSSTGPCDTTGTSATLSS